MFGKYIKKIIPGVFAIISVSPGTLFREWVKKNASDNGSFFKVKLWVFNFHLMKWISIGKNAAEGDD